MHVQLAVADVGKTLRAAHQKCGRIGHIDPSGGNAARGAVRETQQSLTVFVAVAISAGGNVNVGGDRGDVAHEPQQQIQRVRSQIAEAADAGLAQVGHPPPLRIEPALQRAGVAIAVTDAGDAAERPGLHQLFHLQIHRVAPCEEAGLEQHARCVDGALHAPRVGCGKAERFLHEQVLAGGDRSHDDGLVAQRLGADNRRVDVGTERV